MSNVLITGESNFDEKNVKEVFNMCSTEQSCIHIGITGYKISTLPVRQKIFKYNTSCIAGPRNWQPRALTAAHKLADSC